MNGWRVTPKGQAALADRLTPADIAQRLRACQEGIDFWGWQRLVAHAAGDERRAQECLNGQRFYQRLAATWRALLATTGEVAA